MDKVPNVSAGSWFQFLMVLFIYVIANITLFVSI